MQKNLHLKFRILERFSCQADFARHIQRDESSVSRVINKRKNLTPYEQQKWAQILDAKPKELFPNE